MKNKIKSSQIYLSKIIQESLSNLKEKEQKVLELYFGLKAEKKFTLDAIGKKYGITRERVRQIRNTALNKITKNPGKNLIRFWQNIKEFLKNYNGFANQKELIKKFVKDEDLIKIHQLLLILNVHPELVKIKETRERPIIWLTKGTKPNFVYSAQKQLYQILKKNGQPQNHKKLWDLLKRTAFGKKHKAKISKNFVLSALTASKKFVSRDGLFGLKNWPHLNPRNTRDKIHFIFKKTGQPLHFRKLTEHIHQEDFEGKKPAAATVHNELIADERFVLIGRGIYALREWGYHGGTVCEAIKEILSNHQNGLHQEKLIQKILNIKQVSKNTILMNLQTNDCFVRIREKFWKLNG